MFTEFGIFGESNFGILFYQLVIIYIALEKNPNLSREEKIHLKNKRPDLIIGLS